MRLSFQPTADEISSFHIPNSFDDFYKSSNAIQDIFGGKNVTVHVSSRTTFSFQKRFLGVLDGFVRYYPFLTAIVSVQDGIIVDVTWDDGSIFCNQNDADRNTFDYSGYLVNEQEVGYPVRGCWLSIDTCNLKHSEGGTDCDLTLIVVWTGTDSRGNNLQSLDNLYQGGDVPVEKYSGPTLQASSTIGPDARGVIYATDVLLNETTNEPLPFNSQQFSDMTMDDATYLTLVQRDSGEGTVAFPERTVAGPKSESSDERVVMDILCLVFVLQIVFATF